MARDSSLRASDEDRERVAERLRKAAGDGRILAHELEERLARALRAKTYGELDSVIADLPGSRVGSSSGSRSRRGSRSRELARQHPVAALVLAATVGVLVVAAVMVIVLAMLMFWAAWLLVGLILGRRAGWAHHRYVWGYGGRVGRLNRPGTHPRAGSWM